MTTSHSSSQTVIPLAVWPADPESSGSPEALSPAIVRRIIEEYSSPGNTVVVQPGDARNTDGDDDRTDEIDLLIVTPPWNNDGAEPVDQADPEHLFRQCLQALAPDGLMVTVSESPRAGEILVDLAGRTIAAAQRCGFTYLQHVVALRHPKHEGASSVESRQSQESKHVVDFDHIDVLVFAKRAGAHA